MDIQKIGIFKKDFHDAFAEKLKKFRENGNKSETKKLRGGEGQLYLSDKDPNLALKRWFEGRLERSSPNVEDSFPDSVELLKQTKKHVDADPNISKHVDVVKVHEYEKDKDWILRDYDPDSIPLRDAMKDPDVAEIVNNAISATNNKKSEALQKLNKKLIGRKGKPSINLHWSPTQQKILVIDMM